MSRQMAGVAVAGMTLLVAAFVPALDAAAIGTAAPTGEMLPETVDQVVPWTAGGAKDARSQPVPLSGAERRPARAADLGAHRRAKAAAVGGPAPAAELAGGGFMAHAATMPTSFDGLNLLDAMNNGSAAVPSDNILGKSPNRVLQAANEAVRLSSTAGTVIQTLGLNAFFGAPEADGKLYDPKVYYDRNSANPRFYVVALQLAGTHDANAANNISRIWLAIARSSDPADLSTGNWCRYNIDGKRQAGTADESFADYPGLGAGADTFSITANNYRFSNDTFTYSFIRVYNKAAANNATSCPALQQRIFRPSSSIGSVTNFTIQPVQSYTSPTQVSGSHPAYYLSTIPGSSNQYRVYRIINVAGGSPTLAQAVLTNRSYSIPADSPQQGSTTLVDTLDTRVLQAAGIGNDLYGILTTACNITAGTPNESCALDFQISITPGSTLTGIPRSGLGGLGDEVFVHHPSIAVNAARQIASSWEYSGATRYLSSAAMFKEPPGGWSNVSAYAPGTCALPPPLGGTVARAGDVNGAQTDPNLTDFWLSGEHAGQVPNWGCQWRTRIGKVVPTPPASTTLHYTNNVEYQSGPASVGFNLWDLGPYPEDINALPAGHQALIWAGGGDIATCTPEFTDAEFNALVDTLAGNTKVFGWYLWDEPDLVACPSLLDVLKRRAAYIRTLTSGQQKSFVASGGGDGEPAPAAFANSGIDLIGLDPYPCRIGETCEYDLINQAVQQTLANGIPRASIVPIYQAFGQTCSSIPADHRKWRMPTPAELDQIFARWDTLVPNPVFDDAYSWGSQPEWSCPSLSSDPTLQDRFRQHFTG